MTRSPQLPSILAPSSQCEGAGSRHGSGSRAVDDQAASRSASVAEKAAVSACLPPNPQLLGRIRGEYLEMPGLKLTLPQAQRLWHQRERECEGLLGALIDAKFLCRKSDGRYARVIPGGD